MRRILAVPSLAVLCLGTLLGGVARVAAQAEPPVHPSLQADLPGLMRYVERTRGHRFVRPVAVHQDAPHQFTEALDRQRPVVTEQSDAAATYEALHLIPSEIDYNRTVPSADGTLGVYFPGKDLVIVRSGPDTPLLRSIVVHELTHALDDQAFDQIEVDDRIPATSDGAMALRGLVEGDARAVEDDYVAALSADDRRAYDSERQALRSQETESSAPATSEGLRLLGDFPYSAGEQYMRALRRAGGEKAVDKAFDRPPQDSATILNHSMPSPPAPVVDPPDEPDDDPEHLDVRTLGAEGLDAVLTVAGVPAADRNAAVAAWDGDRATTWTGDFVASPGVDDSQLRQLLAAIDKEESGDDGSGSGPDAAPSLTSLLDNASYDYEGEDDCVRWDVQAADDTGVAALQKALGEAFPSDLRHGATVDADDLGVTYQGCTADPDAS